MYVLCMSFRSVVEVSVGFYAHPYILYLCMYVRMYVCMRRSFDDGLSECGLECPMGVLALDSKLDPFYSKQGLRKTAPVNTNFPCGQRLAQQIYIYTTHYYLFSILYIRLRFYSFISYFLINYCTHIPSYGLGLLLFPQRNSISISFFFVLRSNNGK